MISYRDDNTGAIVLNLVRAGRSRVWTFNLP